MQKTLIFKLFSGKTAPEDRRIVCGAAGIEKRHIAGYIERKNDKMEVRQWNLQSV